MTRFTTIARLFAFGFVFIFFVAEAQAQSTRPRRVARPTQKTTTDKSASDPLLRPEPTTSPTAKKTNPNEPLLDVQPVKPVTPAAGTGTTSTGTIANTGGAADTKHAYLLLEQNSLRRRRRKRRSSRHFIRMIPKPGRSLVSRS